MAVASNQERSSRTLLAAGLTAVVVGIALSVTDSAALGSWLTVGALVLVILGLHRFGRTGPDR
jgi:hypothetical protein